MNRKKSIILSGLARLALLILLLGLLVPAGARAADPEPEAPLIIEVVEEIPAEDITESQVPLAAYSDTPARSGVRHVALMGLVLLGVIGYVIYFRRYEVRLYRLRQETALAELQAAARRKGEDRP